MTSYEGKMIPIHQFRKSFNMKYYYSVISQLADKTIVASAFHIPFSFERADANKRCEVLDEYIARPNNIKFDEGTEYTIRRYKTEREFMIDLNKIKSMRR